MKNVTRRSVVGAALVAGGAAVAQPIGPRQLPAYTITWTEGGVAKTAQVADYQWVRDPLTRMPVGGAISFLDLGTGKPTVLAGTFRVEAFGPAAE